MTLPPHECTPAAQVEHGSTPLSLSALQKAYRFAARLPTRFFSHVRVPRGQPWPAPVKVVEVTGGTFGRAHGVDPDLPAVELAEFGGLGPDPRRAVETLAVSVDGAGAVGDHRAARLSRAGRSRRDAGRSQEVTDR